MPTVTDDAAALPARTQPASRHGHPTPLKLLLIWLKIGATSFGGGIATQTMIYSNFIVQREWLTPQQFAQMWAIVQFAPGINLLAFTVLIGKRLGGTLGIAASLFGLLAPSVTITILMAAVYTQIRAWPATQAALKGITPAILAMSMAFSWRLIRPTMRALRQRGNRMVALGIALLLVSVALAALDAQILLIYLLGCIVIGVAYWWQSR